MSRYVWAFYTRDVHIYRVSPKDQAGGPVQRKKERKKERKKDILTSFKRPKWPIRPHKRLHLKCCLVFENNK